MKINIFIKISNSLSSIHIYKGTEHQKHKKWTDLLIFISIGNIVEEGCNVKEGWEFQY